MPGVLPARAQDDAPKPSEHHHTTKIGDTNLAEYFWRQSDEAFHVGNYERAIELHQSVVKIDPGDVESYSIAAWLSWSLDKKEAALAHIQRGLNSNPTNPLMWSAAGEHYDLQKREAPELAEKSKNAYARAVQFLSQTADKNDAQMLRRRLAHAAEKAGDLNLSLSTWRDLVRDFPGDVTNQNNLSRAEKLDIGRNLSVGARHASPKS